LPADPGFLLIRVDDRLLHGQVALGWGKSLNPRTFLIVDDRLAERSLEAEIYRAAAPGECRVEILSTDEFLTETQRGSNWEATILLIRDIESLAKLAQKGYRPVEVNLGGIHEHPDAREILPYLFLSPRDWDLLLEMSAMGVRFVVQDLPDLRSYSWEWLRERQPPEA
jgi:mannose/fructose/N-acetylgalactosamine-specific phosphotransferase system component IIB